MRARVIHGNQELQPTPCRRTHRRDSWETNRLQEKRMKTQLLVVVSDIHCGSDVGLAPPKTTTEAGNEISFGKNIHQEWLWNNWCAGIEQVKTIVGDSPAALLVNGDATEGVHHRNEASLIAALIDTHINMAEECLKPLVDICHKRFVTLGTECHTLHMEDELAARIEAETGAAKDKWHFSINGCEIDAAHHMPTTGRGYLEASHMSICMGNARMNYQRSGHGVPKVFLRGHRHCGGYYSDGSGLFAVTGAWQFLTRHGHKVVTDSIPSPTFLVLDWRGLPEGSLPIVREIKFHKPTHEVTVI